ncbi:MAG: ABC transporter permease [Candidatus Bathyarchaeota archaeon]|nr:MAG: ABC transporter permease [Candidatus Bathyarchaeota archaeon]
MAIGTTLRTIKEAIWLGWKVETNWADPLVFAIYYLIRPIAGLLIVGFIFLIGSTVSGTVNPELFMYLFIGNSFFIYVVQVMMMMSMLIHEDRSHYEVLKHIYLTPGSLHVYIVGRALNGVMNASIALLLTLGLGVIVFQYGLGVPIQIDWFNINLGLLSLTLVLGIICFMAIGFILCAINIMTSKVQFTLNEYVTGILYLFGGVVFLPEILPQWGQYVSNALPVTYFLRLVRFSFLPQGNFDPQLNLLYLLATATATVFVGLILFKTAMFKARRDGLIDKKEEY